jgi:hypothetical protein
MMNERHALMPAQLVIGASTTLLGAVLGAGAAFGLWSQLHHTGAPGVLAVAVVALAGGLLLVGLAAGSLTVRLFLLVAALTLALAFFSGAGLFATLIA